MMVLIQIPEVASTLQAVVLSAVCAAAYSVVFYFKTKSGDNTEKYDPKRLAATMLVGVGVGVSYELMGMDFSQQELSQRLVAYAGTVALVESLIKVGWRRYLKQYFSS